MSHNIQPIYLRGINPVVPTVYDDGLSYMEAIAKLQKKINEIAEVVNGMDIDSVKAQMDELKSYVDNTVTQLRNDVNTSLLNNREWVQQYTNDIILNVERLLNNQDNEIRIWVENALNDFRREVNLLFYSPISGDVQNIGYILKQLYNRIFENLGALRCNEYDNLLLTASEYDNEGLTAYEYDVHGRELLQSN